MVRIAAGTDLFATLRERMASGLPVFGTCAGLILLSDRLSDDSLGGVDRLGGARYHRGPQRLRSTAGVLHRTVDGAGTGRPVAGTFIRAPQILDLGPEVEVLARTMTRRSSSAKVRSGVPASTRNWVRTDESMQNSSTTSAPLCKD